jgi:electron transfer flavoprotein alpha/beta subunit
MGSERGSGATGPLLAELLGRPLVTNVVSIERTADCCICRREAAGGYERVAIRTRFVATVTNASFNVPRAPTLKDKMRAHRLTIERVPALTLSQAPEYHSTAIADTPVVRRYVPQTSRRCTRIEGDTVAQAHALAEYLRSAIASEHR